MVAGLVYVPYIFLFILRGTPVFARVERDRRN